MKAYFRLKPKLSSKCFLKTKLFSNVGYLVAILPKSWRLWDIDNGTVYDIQRKAVTRTKWHVGKTLTKKNRLFKWKIVPLRLCAGMKDILLLLALYRKQFDINLRLQKNWALLLATQPRRFSVKEIVSKKQQKFFYCTKSQYNIVIGAHDQLGEQLIKPTSRKSY